MFLNKRQIFFISIFLMFMNSTDHSWGAMSLKPSVTITEFYDSNPTFSNAGSNRESDFATSLEPMIEISKTENRYTLSGSYGLNRRLYSREPDLNSTSHNAAINLDVQAKEKLKLMINDTLHYTEDSLEVFETGIQVARQDILSNSVSFSAAYLATSRSSINLTMTDNILEFDNPAFIDTRTDTVSLTGIYLASVTSSANLSYSYTNYSFDRDSDEKDIKVHALQLGYSKRVMQDVSIDLLAGSAYMPEIDSDHEWIGTLQIGKTLKRSSLNIGYTHNVTSSTGLIDEINVNERISVDMESEMTKTLKLNIYGNYSKNKTKPSGIARTTSYTAGAEGNWRLKSWMILGLGYSWYKQNAYDSLVNDFTRHRVFVRLVLASNEWRF